MNLDKEQVPIKEGDVVEFLGTNQIWATALEVGCNYMVIWSDIDGLHVIDGEGETVCIHPDWADGLLPREKYFRVTGEDE